MKTQGILQTAVIPAATGRRSSPMLVLAAGVFLVLFLASCSSSRRYENYGPPPTPRNTFSLIVNPGPGFVVSRYPDGRYYYRSPQGYTYWRGYDNRYYIDRRYVSRSYHRHSQYGDWRRYNGRRR